MYSNQLLHHILGENNDVVIPLAQSSGTHQGRRSFADVVDGRNIIPLPLLNWYEHLGDGMSLWT